MITREFKLYLNAGVGVAPVINANQFDQDEEWIFTLLQSDGTVYTPSTGAIIGLKTDGTTILNAGTVNEDGQVVITETEQMTAVPGSNIFEILIDGNSHGTANFVVFVERRPGDIDHPSESDISLFQEAIEAAGNVTQFQADISALQSGLATTNANLTSEANTRASADATLQNNISAEASTRQTQDAVLQAEIDQIIAPSGEAPSAAEVQNARIGVDGTTYDTLGNAIRTQVSDLKNALDNAINDIKSTLYTDGDAITIQNTNANPFIQNSPTGLIHVKSTDDAIYTGSINFIDLFGLAQGVFTDSNSGVTIEITGNEVYIHGSPISGFRFDFQKGEFYTDSFTNHPADFSNFPSDHVIYTFCWWEREGYVAPSNIYIAGLINGTIAPSNLQAHSKAVYFDETNQYLAMYSNGAISNLDFKFTIGLKIMNMPGTFASIEAVAKADYDTKIINTFGYYELQSFTWTGQQTVYDVVEAYAKAEDDPLTDGHIYAWFGDSLSQLKELPNLVADLLHVKVYDCTFAGAPLTYGDPTKYQPTGFMSLCSQIVAGDFTDLSDALDAQEQAGINVTEKRIHLATLQSLDFNEVTDIVLLAGTNDFDNDYVNATKFVDGFSNALTTLLTEYPHLMVYIIAPTWRGDKSEGVVTIPTMEDIVRLEKEVADDFCLPFYDLYHRSGINSLTASVYLTNDLLHPSDAGDSLLANKCSKFIQSN